MATPKSGFCSTVFSALLGRIIGHLDRASLPKYQGVTAVAGLGDAVKITWQSHGIPHVSAKTEHDLFLAQGYLHAQERLWQMDISRRFLSGRIAEIFGNFALPWKELSSHFRQRTSVDFDHFIRLVGISHFAAQSLALLPPEDQLRLKAYSDGVNRYIETCRRHPPWEFRILFYEPEPWRPEDSLIINAGFAFLLSPALLTRLNMTALSAMLRNDPEKLRSLMPSYPEGGPTITHAVWDSLKDVWQFVNGTFSSSDLQPAGQGSNSWAIAPHRSSSGNAILCNDPHLRLTLPSVWYLMHLKAQPEGAGAEAYEVWGATVPGAPFVQIGRNREISWGITAALCDDAELYREKLHRLDPSLYLTGSEWQPFETRQEIIGVRWGKSIRRTIRSSRHGPLISDFTVPLSSGEALAFRWTAHQPSAEATGLYKLNRARNWGEFLDSLSYASAPSLSYVYADKAGNVGYSLAGKIPLRSKVPSLLPLEGWDESNDWLGYIPHDELPRIYNPADGVIATANNNVVDSTYPHYLSHFFEPPYRISRIRELLGDGRQFSIEDMVAIQADLISFQAKSLVDVLRLDLQRISEQNALLRDAADRLLTWNGHCGEDSAASAIYHVWHHRLLANLLVPVLGEDLFSAYLEIFNQSIVPTDEILKDGNSCWFKARSRYELAVTSLREACEFLRDKLGVNPRKWHWGKIHQLTIKHSLARVTLLKSLLTIGPFSSAGDGTTINMGFYRHSQSFEHTVGPSLRIIIDAGDLENSRFVLACGQSGHPTSPHFQDQTALWQSSRYLQFDNENRAGQSVLSMVPLFQSR